MITNIPHYFNAVLLRRPGSLADLQVQEIEMMAPQAGYVLVQIACAGLNPSDYKLALSGTAAWKYPHIMGLDGAGSIVMVGPNTECPYPLGTRVAFYTDFQIDGCFAEYAMVPVLALCPIPDSMDYLQAAALPCAGITAWQALHRRACLNQESVVLIEGAAGGVGSFAVQIAAAKGYRVIGTCSPENNDYVRSLGAQETIDYNLESKRERIDQFTDQRGVDLVLDTISGHSATQALPLLACGGSLVCTAGLPDLSKMPLATNSPTISELSLHAPYVHKDHRRIREMAQDLELVMNMMQANQLQVAIQQEQGLHQVPQALNELRERHVRGKIVLTIAST
jgi:NADPH:quinone reductase-like Zn-dependent oxidoreductase